MCLMNAVFFGLNRNFPGEQDTPPVFTVSPSLWDPCHVEHERGCERVREKNAQIKTAIAEAPDRIPKIFKTGLLGKRDDTSEYISPNKKIFDPFLGGYPNL